jgi:hypothetical protein
MDMPSIGTTAFCNCGDESMGIASGARAFAAITPKPANAPVTMVNSLSANPDFAFSMRLIFLQNSVLVQRSEVSNLVSSGKFQESGFWKFEVEWVAEFVQTGWFL